MRLVNFVIVFWWQLQKAQRNARIAVKQQIVSCYAAIAAVIIQILATSC